MSKRTEGSGSRKPESPKSKIPSKVLHSSKPAPFGDLNSIDEAGGNLSASSRPPPAMKTRVPTQFGTARSSKLSTLLGTTLNRDKSMAPDTALSHDKSMAPGSTLNRDKSTFDPLGSGTTLNRDISKFPKAESMLVTAVASKRPASMAPRNVPSILTLPKDKAMAVKQLKIEDMGSKERKDQEAWAEKQLKKNQSCPEKFKWERRNGGYQCEAGAHGITDALLAEGKNGMIVLRKKNWDDFEGWEGPYYPNPAAPGYWKISKVPME